VTANCRTRERAEPPIADELCTVVIASARRMRARYSMVVGPVSATHRADVAAAS